MLRSLDSHPRPHFRHLLTVALLVVALCAVSADSAVALALPEPNDNALQAAGPLAAETDYDFLKETTNDADWTYFYTPSQSQLGFSATYVGGGSCDGNFRIADDKAETIKFLHVSPSEPFDNHTLTAPGAKKYFIVAHYNQSEYNVDCVIRIRISSTAGLTNVIPPTSFQISACVSAQQTISKYTKARRSASRKLKRAKSKSRRKDLKKKISRYSKRLSKAKKSQSTYCTVQVLELLQNDPVYR